MQLLKLSWLLAILLSFLSPSLSAQKVLALYQKGKKKPLKFYIGDELTFKVKSSDFLYTLPIRDLDYATGEIIFSTGTNTTKGSVNINEIEIIKTFRDRRMAKTLSRGLYVFGGSWSLYSIVGALVGGTPLTWSVAVVTGVSAGLGWVIWRIFRQKVHKLKKGKYLQILDIGVNVSSSPNVLVPRV